MTANPHQANTKISIHALRGEGDQGFFNNLIESIKFQSTPSVGRATIIIFKNKLSVIISIHALRGEGDYGAG